MATSHGRRRAMRLLLPAAGIAGLVSGCTLDFDSLKSAALQPDISFITDGGGDTDGGPDFQPTFDAATDAHTTTDGGVGADSDGDGIADATDNCPMVANPDQLDTDGDHQGDACDDDSDDDGIPNAADNCPLVANPDQLDFDRDGQGDACDSDPDGDGLDEAAETAKGTNPHSADTDGDGVSDATDNCPTVADRLALDKDSDGAGDACDPDDDGDAVPDWKDNCPQTVNADQADADNDGRGDACAGDLDSDGVADGADTCPALPNPTQALSGCVGAFRSLTYGRDIRALAGTADGVVGATGGGLAQVTPMATTVVTNRNGLAENPLNGAFVDSHGRRWAVSNGALSVVRPDGFVFRMGPHDLGGGPQAGTGFRSVAVDANDIVYVGSDLGLNVLNGATWTLLTAPTIPSNDVRGLWLSPTGQVWAATAAGAARLVNGAVDRTVTGIQGIGDDLLNIGGEADGSVWLLARNGAGLLAPDGAQPSVTFTGFEARAMTPGPNGNRYLATSDGVRRVDVDGRMFPPGSSLLPSADVRAISGPADQPRWVGTADGLVEMDGYFASFAPDATNFNRPCVSVSTRIGANLWVGTDQGLFLYHADGTFQHVDAAGLPGQLIKVIRQIDTAVWVGTDAGIGLFNVDGSAQSQLTAANGLPAAPISDIIAGVDSQIWIASDGNGIVRRGADGMFTAFTHESVGNNFLSNNVKALAHDGGTLWVGSDAGVSVFTEANQAFAFPVTNLGGQLPDTRVQDIAVGGGSVYVATPQGVAVHKPDNQWVTLRRATGGWPNATGSDYARAVAFDGTALWILLADSARQPFGALLRREGLEALQMDSDGGDIVKTFTSDNAGIVAAKGRSVNLEWTGSELFASWCGAADDVGGFSVIEGPRVITQDASPALGLPSGAGDTALTVGPAGVPIFTAAHAGGAPQAYTLAPGASIADAPVSTSFAIPASVPGVLRKCAAAPGTGELWCAIGGVGVGRRLDEATWVVLSGAQIPNLQGGDVRDIAVDGPQSVWIATGKGVIRLNVGNPQLYNQARGLPSDDVRSVTLAPDGKVYAGTSAGVGVFDPGTTMWTTIARTPGGLGNADVRAVAAGSDGTLYIGTADGLFRLGVDGNFTDFHAGSGLPSNDVRSLALTADGKVLVGTSAGLAIGAAGGADLSFTVAGFADGLPGHGIFDIVTSVDGRVWVRSDDGVALLQN